VLIALDEVTTSLYGSDVAAVVNYVDYAQLAREGEASRTYLLERFGVPTDEMRAGL
jgi:5-methylthioadenosine/S-adenosylhomocysteine deaminase